MNMQTDKNDVPAALDAPDEAGENTVPAVQASEETDNTDKNDALAVQAPVEADGETAAVPRPSMLISLGRYGNDDYLTKKELCAVFSCGPRTLQRMVDRFEIPPPVWFAGRNTWIVGNLRAWIAEAAKRKEAGALRVAKKMRVFDD